MATVLPHRVRRLRWQARAPSADAAFALRALLRDAAEPVLAALEQGLSAHAPADRAIHLPRLELRLRFDPVLDADELCARVAAATAEALAGLDLGSRALAVQAPEPAVEAAGMPVVPAAPAAAVAPPPVAAPSLPVATALALDTALRSAPAELRAAVAAALNEAEFGAAAVDLRWRGHAWRLPAASLRHLARHLGIDATGGAVVAIPPASEEALPAGPRDAARPALPGDAGSPARSLPDTDRRHGRDRSPEVGTGRVGAQRRSPTPHPARSDVAGKEPAASAQPGPEAPPAAAAQRFDALAHPVDANGGRTDPRAEGDVGPDPLQADAQSDLAGYLKSGGLDWPVAGLARESILQRLREAARVWARLGVLPAAVFELPAGARPGALARWLALLPQETRSALVDDFAVPPALARHPLSAALSNLLEAGGPGLAAAQALWLAWAVSDASGLDDRAGWRRTTQAWLDALPAAPAAEGLWQPVRLALAALAAAPGEAADAGVPPGDAGDAAAASASQIGVAGSAHPAEPVPDRTGAGSLVAWAAHDAIAVRAAPAGLVVAAAGLVLLHPFLPRLFEACGLYPAGGRGAIAESGLPVAAALLHGLASGGDEGPDGVHEFELGFVKVLLGQRPDTPLAQALPRLDATQRSEVAALLDAVLGHWQALRGTSVEGLRTGFLQRRGLLEARDGAWWLRVEPESFDLLLGLLPWSLGLVRLPWMTQPLITEWSAP